MGQLFRSLPACSPPAHQSPQSNSPIRRSRHNQTLTWMLIFGVCILVWFLGFDQYISEYQSEESTIKLWHGCSFSGSVSIFAVCGEDWFDFWGLLTSTYFSIWNFQMVVEWWSLSDINWDDGESAWDRCCLQPEWSFQSFNVIGFDFLQATPPGWKPTPDPSQALK